MILPALLVATPAFASSAVDNAFLLCRIIDNTHMASAPCEVSGWNSSVTATIDMTSADARQACAMIVGLVQSKSMHFDGTKWTLQIKSPYSGDKTIAFCNLPK